MIRNAYTNAYENRKDFAGILWGFEVVACGSCLCPVQFSCAGFALGGYHCAASGQIAIYLGKSRRKTASRTTCVPFGGHSVVFIAFRCLWRVAREMKSDGALLALSCDSKEHMLDL